MSKKCFENKGKTQKNKSSISSKEKKKLWELYDIDKKEEEDIECVYEKSPNNNIENKCEICSSSLIIMDDGFPTCTNKSCGIIYRDILDHSPEWRYYGAEDKNSADPTRCGNPINPLLQESSFGCKILCGPNSSYEMKRIRKWTEWQAMPHREKSLYDEFQFITVMAKNSGIPRIFIDDAMAKSIKRFIGISLSRCLVSNTFKMKLYLFYGYSQLIISNYIVENCWLKTKRGFFRSLF